MGAENSRAWHDADCSRWRRAARAPQHCRNRSLLSRTWLCHKPDYNGFLLTRKLVAELEDAGLQVMQISVDRMTPSSNYKEVLKDDLAEARLFS
jgi:hypothetical protein